MPADPNVKRQLRGAEDMRHSLRRNIDNLDQQIRLLQRQDRESARLPDASRVQSGIRQQIRDLQRTIARNKTDIRTLDRQIGDLKRMA